MDNPLNQLRDIHLPEPVSAWPPAPGWWILLVAGVLAMTALAYLLVKRHRKNAYRRRALLQLDSLHSRYQATGNDGRYLEQINALLKGVALLAYPRPGVAAQHGESWRTLLNHSLPTAEHFQPAFDDAAYQKTRPEIDVTQVHRAARSWIKNHKVTQ